jgi:hypothetical protein
MAFKELLTTGVGVIGLIWYFVCLCALGLKPTPAGQAASGFRQFQALSVTTIGVALSTFVGWIVGIKQTGASSLAAQGVAAAASGVQQAASAVPVSGSITSLQVSAAWLYVGSLVVAIAFYAYKKDEAEPAITNLAKSLLGFVVGVFSVVLGAP